jgi:glycosyltransferase involved in cell wall biosynthesis
MLDNTGYSGTETALLEVGHYLVQRGHTVILTGFNITTKYTADGMTYIPHEQLLEQKSQYLSNLDFFCPIFYVHIDHHQNDILNELDPQKTFIWIWMQCNVQHYPLTAYFERGFRMCASFLSPFVEQFYDKSMFHSCVTIGNAIGTHFLQEVQTPQQKKGRWVFHASYERGGDIANLVFHLVQKTKPEVAKSLHYASYDTVDHNKSNDQNDVHFHGSLGKRDIASLLSSADYFVYPLVLPSGLVHHDTYGSVMLEALASGAIVVTWNIACIPSVYHDYVIGITPTWDDSMYDPFSIFGTVNHYMNSYHAIETMANTILEIEKHPDYKEKVRRRGMEWARKQIWENRGKSYEQWLLSALAKS